MSPLRQLCIWFGVGAGHVALVVSLWGAGVSLSGPAQHDGDLVLLLTTPEPAPVQAETPAVTIPYDVPASGVRSLPPAVVASHRMPIATPNQARLTSGEPASVVGTPPSFIHRVEPPYPRGARLAGIQGVVRLGLEVGADGALRRVQILASSGDKALDHAAVSAAETSTYSPAHVGTRAVDAEVEASYRFELR